MANLGIHIINFPSNRWGFVGTLPAWLGDVEPATVADVMAGRAETNPHDGKAYTVRFPSFTTRAEAEAHFAVRRRGHGKPCNVCRRLTLSATGICDRHPKVRR